MNKKCLICDEQISEFDHCCIECAEERIRSIKNTIQYFVEKNRQIKIMLKIIIDMVKKSKNASKEFEEVLLLLDKAIKETGGIDEDLL